MNEPTPDPTAAADDLVARCILVYERDGDRGVDALLADNPGLADPVRARFADLRAAGLLLPPAAQPEQIGPYRVLRHLGSGGMGSVFLAEQQEPVARLVAIKVIRPGMDSQEVLARFTVERQALALLDHPHVARIFDAGLTAEGRPFLVMEHVDGVPLLRYCDERRLSMTARLQLFARVCDAVQHAHQKGVIHRDLKPSNVLVAERDGAPWPVVIDFGVAKAVRGRLGVRATVTEPGQLLGTPEYMSPEQARNEVDVDTRTDVYSLGVMLFELLTGTLPIRRGQHRRFDRAQLQRLLDETEAPTPSSRITDLGADVAGVAGRRATDPTSLRRRLRGDLDWIVLKAIARDRDRRYGMPADLALDLQRHLRDEPVSAGPETTRYRFGKFLRRHRLQAGAVAAVAVALVGGLATSFAFWRTAAASEQAARRQAERAERNLDRALAATSELLSFGRDPLLDLPHMEPVRRELMQKALVQFRAIEAIDIAGDPRATWHVADAQHRIAQLQMRLGDVVAARTNLEAAHRRLLALEPANAGNAEFVHGLAVVELALADAFSIEGQFTAMPPLLQRSGERARSLWQQGPATHALRQLMLDSLLAQGRYARRFDRDRVRALYDEADAVAAPWRTAPLPDAAYVVEALAAGCEHARMLIEFGDAPAARERATALAREVETAAPKTAPRLLQRRFLPTIRLVGNLHFDLEQRPPAIEMLGRAQQIVEELVREHPDVVSYHVDLVQIRTSLFMTRNREGQAELAMRDHAACLAAAETLVALDDGPTGRLLLATALLQGAYARIFHRGMGGEVDLAAVRVETERGLEILAGLPTEVGDAHRTQRLEALGVQVRAQEREIRGDLDGAIDDFAAAIAMLDALVRDPDDVEISERSLHLKVLRADLLLRRRRVDEARAVFEMALPAMAELKSRHARPDDWRVKDRNIREALARVRGMTGDVAGAVELFGRLGQQENDWIGRDKAGQGLLELCRSLPADDGRRADLLARARTVLHSSLDRERAKDLADRSVLVMRSGTCRILAEVEQEAGNWPAAATAWAGVVGGYAASFAGRASDRNRERLAQAMQAHAHALLQCRDVAAARAIGVRMAERFAGKPAELLAAAELALRCVSADPSGAEVAADREAAVGRLLAAIAAGHRDAAALHASPALAPLLAEPRVAKALAEPR